MIPDFINTESMFLPLSNLVESNPVVIEWTEEATLDDFHMTGMQFIQLLDKYKMPRQGQREAINFINTHILQYGVNAGKYQFSFSINFLIFIFNFHLCSTFCIKIL